MQPESSLGLAGFRGSDLAELIILSLLCLCCGFLLHQLGGVFFVVFFFNVIAASVEATARKGSEPSCVPLGQASPRPQAAQSLPLPTNGGNCREAHIGVPLAETGGFGFVGVW